MNNRKPITIRLNQAEQFAMLNLLQFWGKDERGVVKLALAQLIKATNELQRRLQEEQDAKGNDSGDGPDRGAEPGSSDREAVSPDAPSAGSDDSTAAVGSAD